MLPLPAHLGSFSFFFFNDTATTEIYTLSLHDALPISRPERRGRGPAPPPSWGRPLRAVPAPARAARPLGSTPCRAHARAARAGARTRRRGTPPAPSVAARRQIGRASCRERV